MSSGIYNTTTSLLEPVVVHLVHDLKPIDRVPQYQAEHKLQT